MKTTRAHQPKIAIIGAGIAGLTAARSLAEQFEVTIFEKSRGLGGRLATRYADSFEFDHGAQYFTVTHPAFAAVVEQMQADNIVQLWQGDFVELADQQPAVCAEHQSLRYVGVPRMNAVGKYLARDLSVCINHRVTRLIRTQHRWQLEINDSPWSEVFDWVLFAIPAEQIPPLLPEATQVSKTLSSVVTQGCHVLMLGCRDSVVLPDWHGARIHHSCIQWISRNSSKPQRGAQPTVVALSNNQWSADRGELDLEQVQNLLWAAVAPILNASIDQIEHISIHHWRYANCIQPLHAGNLLDQENHLALCGDWTQGAKVEAAFLSGLAAAHNLSTYLQSGIL